MLLKDRYGTVWHVPEYHTADVEKLEKMAKSAEIKYSSQVPSREKKDFITTRGEGGDASFPHYPGI